MADPVYERSCTTGPLIVASVVLNRGGKST